MVEVLSHFEGVVLAWASGVVFVSLFVLTWLAQNPPFPPDTLRTARKRK